MLSKLTNTLAMSAGVPILKVLISTSKSIKSIKPFFSSENTIVVPPEATNGPDISGSYLLRRATKILQPWTSIPPQTLQHQRPNTEEEGEAPVDLLGDILSDSGEEG